MKLEIQSLACRRGGRLVFEDVSCALGPGEALVVTGGNGAGKSTLLAALAGRLTPSAGHIVAEGLGDRTLPEALHWVGHREGLKSALTAEENLTFARDLLGAPWLSPTEALRAVGLPGAARLPVGYLSAGQRRRVALARLMVARRPLWLLDEPTAALDAASQDLLLGLMRRHLDEGGLIVAATHAPLGLESAKELRIGRPISSPRARGEVESRKARPGEVESQDEALPASPPHPEASPLDPPVDARGPALSPLAGRGGTAAFLALVRRDLRLAARVGGSGGLGLVFFLMLVMLIPFAIGPDLNLLSRIGPAILWLAAVLATLIGFDRLFQADEEDGSLDLLLTASLPLEAVVVAKALAHWLTTGLPLALASPLYGLLVALPAEAMPTLVLTLLVGTPALTFIGATGAALTASIRRGGLILAILVVPLMVPTLIFGVTAAATAQGGTVPLGTPLLLLAAITLIAGVTGTAAATAALRSAE